MASTIAGIAMMLALGGWHLRIRRHANWQYNRDARFYITTGYPMLAIGVYFLVGSTGGTDWLWALGCLWTLCAMVSFVYGFQSLDSMVRDQRRRTPRSGIAREKRGSGQHFAPSHILAQARDAGSGIPGGRV